MTLFSHSLSYMIAPMVVCVFITSLLTGLGIHVLRRGVIFVDLALAQIAALGTTYAFYLGHDPMGTMAWVYSLGFTCLGAALFSLTRSEDSELPQEAIIGISYAVAAGAVILLVDMARDPHGGEKIQHLLVGNLVWVTWPEVLKTAGVCLAVGAFHFFFRGPFNQVTFHPEEAKSDGRSLRFWDFLFYVSFGVAITSIVRVAGVLLVFSYLIIPATIATLYCTRIRSRVILGCSIGLVVSFFGLLFSYDRPSGPMIVTLFGLCLAGFGTVRFLRKAAGRTKEMAALGGCLTAILFLLAGLPHLVPPEPHEHHHHHQGGEADAAEVHDFTGHPDVSSARSILSHGAARIPKKALAEKDASPLNKARNQLFSADSIQREAAIDALARENTDAVSEALVKALETEDDDGLRLKLGKILAERKAPAGAAELVRLLHQAEAPFVRMEALDALKNIAGQDFGYDALADSQANAQALKKWDDWLKKRTSLTR